jgi:signal transduction histidine kinase
VIRWESSLPLQPSGNCRSQTGRGLTDPLIFWLRNVSDLLIGAAYALIPFGLASFLSERRDIEFGWLAWLFAVFIALCGATHWMHIWLVFFPHYTAEAFLKAVTALASITTAGAVIALLPEIKRLPTPAMMEQEHSKRIKAEVALRDALEERSNRELQKHVETQDLLIKELNHRVKNTLATVQAMAALSFKEIGAETRPSLDAFQARLLALPRRITCSMKRIGPGLLWLTSSEPSWRSAPICAG